MASCNNGLNVIEMFAENVFQKESILGHVKYGFQKIFDKKTFQFSCMSQIDSLQ